MCTNIVAVYKNMKIKEEADLSMDYCMQEREHAGFCSCI